MAPTAFQLALFSSKEEHRLLVTGLPWGQGRKTVEQPIAAPRAAVLAFEATCKSSGIGLKRLDTPLALHFHSTTKTLCSTTNEHLAMALDL